MDQPLIVQLSPFRSVSDGVLLFHFRSCHILKQEGLVYKLSFSLYKLFEPHHDKTNIMTCALSEDSGLFTIYSKFLVHIHTRYIHLNQMGRVKRIWYLSPMRAAKVQASLRIRAVSPEPPLLAHTSSESRGTFRQKARSLVPLNG